MASYEVIVERKTRRGVARLPSTVYGRVLQAIDGLAEAPRPQGSRQLQGREGWRLRVGNYRIVYYVNDDRREVFVAEVWHRQRGCR